MKNLLIATIISGAIFVLGCEKENPVSSSQTPSKHSLQKNIRRIPDPLTEFIYASLQTSGYYLNNPKFSFLEIYGNGEVSGIGYCKIFSVTKITSTIQTGTIDITTDNGDKITGTLSGRVQSGTGSVLSFTGKYKLLYGTGSFTGITGNGDYSGNISKNGIDGNLVLNGIIYLPEIIRVDRIMQNTLKHDKVQEVRLEKLAINF